MCQWSHAKPGLQLDSVTSSISSSEHCWVHPRRPMGTIRVNGVIYDTVEFECWFRKIENSGHVNESNERKSYWRNTTDNMLSSLTESDSRWWMGTSSKHISIQGGVEWNAGKFWEENGIKLSKGMTQRLTQVKEQMWAPWGSRVNHGIRLNVLILWDMMWCPVECIKKFEGYIKQFVLRYWDEWRYKKKVLEGE